MYFQISEFAAKRALEILEFLNVKEKLGPLSTLGLLSPRKLSYMAARHSDAIPIRVFVAVQVIHNCRTSLRLDE